MYFGVVDHYNYDTYDLINVETINNDNIDQCFICFEIKCPNGNYPIKLNSKLYYYKKCSCDGFIHKFCLDIWYNKSSRCPICRDIIEKRTQFTKLLLYNGTNILFIYLNIKNNIGIIFRYFFIIFLFFEIIKFYLIIIDKNYFLYDELEYNNYYIYYHFNNTCNLK